VQLTLDTVDAAVALRTAERGDTELAAARAPDLSLEQRVLEHLAASSTPIRAAALRKQCQVRNTALRHALATLVAAGEVRKDRAGYALAR